MEGGMLLVGRSDSIGIEVGRFSNAGIGCPKTSPTAAEATKAEYRPVHRHSGPEKRLETQSETIVVMRARPSASPITPPTAREHDSLEGKNCTRIVALAGAP